jgi:predicted NodU family carbamoyl transferase
MNILGISAYYHDSAAALIHNGEIISAAQEERFTRKKHDAAFPTNALKYCLSSASLHPDEIDYVVFYVHFNRFSVINKLVCKVTHTKLHFKLVNMYLSALVHCSCEFKLHLMLYAGPFLSSSFNELIL